MKRYQVVLNAMAFVSQVQWVEADSLKEAEEIALGKYNELRWDYDGIDDPTVYAEAVDPCGVEDKGIPSK